MMIAAAIMTIVLYLTMWALFFKIMAYVLFTTHAPMDVALSFAFYQVLSLVMLVANILASFKTVKDANGA